MITFSNIKLFFERSRFNSEYPVFVYQDIADCPISPKKKKYNLTFFEIIEYIISVILAYVEHLPIIRLIFEIQ